jgi:predicted DNA-binding transcriptional regulator YafY
MLVADIKQNNYPNSASFAEKLRNIDIDENQNIACTAKTIQRDIKILKEEYNAPIEFDPEQHGYYLKHHGWNFQCPVFEEHDLVAAILGAKLAEDVFPNPLKQEIRDATDNLLTENNPELLDTAIINALVVATGLKVTIDPDVFQIVFEGWTQRKAIEICYRNAKGTVTERTIEPHVLVYQEYSWFIKGYCLLRNEVRTFAVHRIESAELTDLHFDRNPDIVKVVREGLLFSYKKTKNIKIKCEPALAPYVIDQPLHGHQKIDRHEDGSFIVTLPEATEYDIISWVLAQAGRAVLLAPKTLKTRIAKTAADIAKKH